MACFAELEGGAAEPLGRGLINETYRVRSARGDFVLQRLSPIFDPAVNYNIRAVTERLAAANLPTPRLLCTTTGRPWADLGEAGVWRLLTFVAGTSFEAVRSTAQARAAGALVARFHAALSGLRHEFAGRRLGVHDTMAHLAALGRAVAERSGHRLHAEVAKLAGLVLAAAARLPELPALPERPCHGDLKLANVMFAGPEPPASEQAVCLIDLDTVGPMSLACELGDAWRSWCNPGGEALGQARFDLDVFAAAWEGYRDALPGALSPAERRGLLYGIEWISLELCARFAADALGERYFGWNRTRYPAPGEHHIARARSQWALHEDAVRQRAERAALLGIVAD